MGSLLIVLIILGCVAYQYLKGTFVKSFALLITSICASVAAFSYFELLANVLIKGEILMSWAYSLSFVLLFVLAFAVLQTIAVQLTRQQVDLGFLPERIGRVICGIFLGFIISGLLLTAAAMAPISAKYPYQRFDEFSTDPENPGRMLLNADGFVTGWFNIISSGSFSSKKSFATLHPAFLDQLFLNRLEITNGVPTLTGHGAIEIPRKAVWPAPEGLKDSDGKTDLSKSGYKLTIVRVKMNYQVIKKGGIFTPSQLRLICKKGNDDRDLLAGKGKNIYPVGYMKTADELQIRNLTDHIEIKDSDFTGRVKEIDFAFYVPDGFVPVLFEFKQNSINELPPPIPVDQAPPPAPFVKPSEPATDANAAESPPKDTTEDTTEPNSPE
jgi:hypothetical protein